MCLALRASGLWLRYAPLCSSMLRYAPLCCSCTAKFDPFLSLDCALTPSTLHNPRKRRHQILPSGNLVSNNTPRTKPLNQNAPVPLPPEPRLHTLPLRATRHFGVAVEDFPDARLRMLRLDRQRHVDQQQLEGHYYRHLQVTHKYTLTLTIQKYLCQLWKSVYFRATYHQHLF